MEFVEIDGSHGEGGGQIIRTALTLSAITKKPVRIANIRAKRPSPGLAMQHLTAAKAVRSICRGVLESAEQGSTTLAFTPGEIVGGRYDFNIGTAGSCTLVAQTVLPIALFASKPSVFHITGGTHVMKSPSYDYFENVFVPALENMGIKTECRMLKSGFYPRGGGEIEVRVAPGTPEGCELWNAEEQVRVLIRLSKLEKSIAIREKKIFVQENINDVFMREDEALDPGNAVLAWSGFRGAGVLGEKSKRAEIVAKEALDGIRACKGFDVDAHLADQLLIYAALAEGKTGYSMPGATEHLKTNASIISKFTERKISVDANTVRVD